MPQPQTAPEPPDPAIRQNYVLAVLGELVAALESIVGAADSAGFISIAAQKVTRTLEPQQPITREELAEVLVALQLSVGADFYVVEETPDTIVLGNRICPFAQHVLGRTSLCMSTSNMLGSVAAKHLGYARVDLQKTIAQGSPECLVTIHLNVPPPAAIVQGREYFTAAAK